MTENWRSGFGSRLKNSMRSSNAAMPSYWPRRINVPTIVMRGEYDGIASFDDLIEFYRKLPHPDKQFSVMAGISHASFQQKNYMMVYHILHAFFSQPEPVYRA